MKMKHMKIQAHTYTHIHNTQTYIHTFTFTCTHTYTHLHIVTGTPHFYTEFIREYQKLSKEFKNNNAQLQFPQTFTFNIV